jgi:V8-like Glu-specific endopeptidase
MKRPLVGVLSAALFGAAALTGVVAAPAVASEQDASRAAAAEPAAAPDFAGTVALSNCSGSVVRVPQSQPGDPALVLSNGHCLESGMPDPGEVVTGQPSSRGFTLLGADGGDVASLRATELAYATMTGTDVSLYELSSTYEEIESQHGIQALDLATSRPAAGADMSVVSGYWKNIYTCKIDGFVHELHEAGWVMKDSIRYTPECETIGGTSGSPIIDHASGDVIGVNNTGNESGGECTMNNPCEVDENGQVTVREGINYGQQVHQIAGCVGTGNQVDLSLAGCALPKP